jgi:hypothetical protein
MPPDTSAAAALPEALVFRPKPAAPPPSSTIGVVGWMRANLFSSVPNALLTLLGAYVTFVFFQAIINWALIDAVWEAENRRQCLDQVGRAGACWPGVAAWIPNLLYGLYPKDQVWRINLGGLVLLFGLAAGLVVAAPMCLMLAFASDNPAATSPFTGYLLMLLALSLIFVGVKRHRDHVLGGVIKFAPALLVGLGISAVASVIYVIGWEITLAASNYSFAETYSAGVIEAARAKGASAAEIARVSAEAEAFRTQYMNPLFRLPLTFVEIFPVGVLVSLVAAGLLRNSRFLPARAMAA